MASRPKKGVLIASGKNRAKNEQKQIAEGQLGKLSAAQDALMKPTPVQEALDARTMRILNHKGDWGSSPDVNWAAGQVAALKENRLAKNRGAYTFGSRYADPNLLAALGSQEEAAAAQEEQLGRERAIGSTIDSALGSALPSAGLTANRYGTVANSAASTWGNANSNYTQMQNRPGFWSQALLGGLGAAGSFFSDERLKTNIQHPDGTLYATWDWNEKAGELGLFGSSQGVVAQELQKIKPELVSVHPSGYLQVDYLILSGEKL